MVRGWRVPDAELLAQHGIEGFQERLVEVGHCFGLAEAGEEGGSVHPVQCGRRPIQHLDEAKWLQTVAGGKLLEQGCQHRHTQKPASIMPVERASGRRHLPRPEHPGGKDPVEQRLHQSRTEEAGALVALEADAERLFQCRPHLLERPRLTRRLSQTGTDLASEGSWHLQPTRKRLFGVGQAERFKGRFTAARALAATLATALPGEAVAIYAGASRSGIHRDGEFASVEREEIKAAVRTHEIRLVVATDAECEGLNLQTLGTMINVDLPWNPSRLEQRLGRIKRFGQRRQNVDTLNLVYHDTQDEKVYAALSHRMKDRYDIFGSLPDTIDDDWMENIERPEETMDQYMHLRQQARDAFEIRYERQVDTDRDRWELCSRVLARRDIVEKLSTPW